MRDGARGPRAWRVRLRAEALRTGAEGELEG